MTELSAATSALPSARPASEPPHARTVWTLALGAFGLAFSLTTTAAFLPPLLGGFTDSTTLIALVLVARLSAAERNVRPGEPEGPEPIV